MEAHEDELGPIDIVVIAYPAEAPMTGEAVPMLVDLVDRGIIRVLDVLFVRQNEDALEPGSAAVMIVYENRWAAPFANAVRRNGGVLILTPYSRRLRGHESPVSGTTNVSMCRETSVRCAGPSRPGCWMGTDIARQRMTWPPRCPPTPGLRRVRRRPELTTRQLRPLRAWRPSAPPASR